MFALFTVNLMSILLTCSIQVEYACVFRGCIVNRWLRQKQADLDLLYFQNKDKSKFSKYRLRKDHDGVPRDFCKWVKSAFISEDKETSPKF